MVEPAPSAVSLRGVSKSYKIFHRANRPTTLSEAVVQRVRHPLMRNTFETFQALNDITLEIPWGEAVGIVGRNGAGKSTLLKLLTRITAPSSGRIELAGRIGSLLEVGTGFHGELTGRENIYLNGTLLGMRRKEIQRRFDEIVDFSGVEKFLDTQGQSANAIAAMLDQWNRQLSVDMFARVREEMKKKGHDL